jgi:UDP-N-acetylmuramoyl-tripeptide--D-alanyl-D-alanine ligase
MSVSAFHAENEKICLLFGALASSPEKYSVVATKDNYNTPLGIANLVKSKLNNETQILIIEMGEYVPGDIRDMTRMLDPHYVVITGINEAHLERMGNIHTTISAIFEIVKYSKDSSKVYLNGDDELIKQNYQKYIQDRNVFLYSKLNTKLSYKIKAKNYLENGDGIFCTLIKNDKSVKNFVLPILGSYAIGTANGMLAISESLNLSEDQIIKGLCQIKSVPHRLQKLKSQSGVLVIDDSYNGNSEGVKEAILTLSQFKSRRKIYLTPGLVETGKMAKEIHTKIGNELSHVADLVILIKNSVTPFIEEGLIASGYKKEKIIWFESTSEAHNSLSKLLQENDIILFQNDWPDNYV